MTAEPRGATSDLVDDRPARTPAVRKRSAQVGRGRPAYLRIRGPISRGAYLGTAVGGFLALLLVWWSLTAFGVFDELFLPSPGSVATTLWEQGANGELWSDLWVSVYRISVGYLIATAMAIPIGLLMGAYRIFEAALEPLLDFIRYMPVVAFVPLTILWAGTGDTQKFLIIWLGTFFQQVLMVAADVRRVPPDLINLGRTLGMSERRIVRRIVFRAAGPGIWDIARVTLGWAWTWLVVAELVAATSGLGYRITVAQRFFGTDLIIAYVIVLGILGLIADQTMRALGRRMFRYEGFAR